MECSGLQGAAGAAAGRSLLARISLPDKEASGFSGRDSGSVRVLPLYALVNFRSAPQDSPFLLHTSQFHPLIRFQSSRSSEVPQFSFSLFAGREMAALVRATPQSSQHKPEMPHNLLLTWQDHMKRQLQGMQVPPFLRINGFPFMCLKQTQE